MKIAPLYHELNKKEGVIILDSISMRLQIIGELLKKNDIWIAANAFQNGFKLFSKGLLCSKQ